MWVHTQYAVTQGVTTLMRSAHRNVERPGLTIINKLNTVFRIVLHNTLLEAYPQGGMTSVLNAFAGKAEAQKAVPLAIGAEEKTGCKGIRWRPWCDRRNKGQ